MPFTFQHHYEAFYGIHVIVKKPMHTLFKAFSWDRRRISIPNSIEDQICINKKDKSREDRMLNDPFPLRTSTNPTLTR